MAYVILQPASTIGSREYGSSFFAKLVERHRQNRYPLFAKGRAVVSLVDTRDIGRAMVWLADHAQTFNQTYLLKGYDTTWYDVKVALDNYLQRRAKPQYFYVPLVSLWARLITSFTPHTQEPEITPLAVALFSENVLIDDDKLRQTGFSPQYNLRDSIGEAVTFFDRQTSSP